MIQLFIRLFLLLASPWPLLAGVALTMLLQPHWWAAALLVGVPAVVFSFTQQLRDYAIQQMMQAIIRDVENVVPDNSGDDEVK